MVTGVAWYRREQWARLVEISSDPGRLEKGYDEWLRTATEGTAALAAAGMTLRLIDVDVEALLAWCTVRGRRVDGPARSEYAAFRVRQECADRTSGKDEPGRESKTASTELRDDVTKRR